MNLKFLGLYKGKIDGIKGQLTKSGTIRFKEIYGVNPINDIVNQPAIDKMREIICEIQRTVGATADGVAGSETISKKAESDANQGSQANEWNFAHFQRSEFACKCGCGFDSIDTRLVSILEEIRSHFGDKPMIVTSGCRCSNHNANVGGVKGSRHTLGKASDIYIKGVSATELLRYCQQLVNEGKLRYTYTNSSNTNGVVHVDIV
jgi:uncharacterized protein YcbK (DUF882 family)